MNAEINKIEPELIHFLEMRGYSTTEISLELLNAEDGLVVYDLRGSECRILKRISLLAYWRQFEGNHKIAISKEFSEFRMHAASGVKGKVDICYVGG